MSHTHREVELRFRVDDPTALLERLHDEGAVDVGAGVVETSAFDFPDRRLRAARQTLRLRDDWTGTTLTAKVPLRGAGDEAGEARARDEINLPLATGLQGEARAILESLGLIETLHYVKERRSWDLDGTHIDVDVLRDGGQCYVEIEAESEEIAAMRRRLGLADAPIETRSYFDIVQQARTATP